MSVSDDDTVFTTARLLARRWRMSDLAPLLEVYGDAEAMRWVGDGSPITPEGCERWMEVTRANYERRGYGMFALEDRASGQVLGFIGLVHPGNQPEAEIKYALRRSAWGRGLASEAAKAMVQHAHEALGIRHIIATAAPENAASHAVLLKAGLQRGALRDNGDGTQTQLFAWSAD